MIAIVLAVAACVSLSRPSGRSGGNVPVVRGAYKSGSEQQVRILLTTPDTGSVVGSTGDWTVFSADGDQPFARLKGTQQAGFTVHISADCTGGL